MEITLAWIVEHLLEIVLTLVSAGALALCKYFHKQIKAYRDLVKEKEKEEFNKSVDSRLDPLYDELEELRRYVMNLGDTEKRHLNIIVASYRYRLIALCKEFINQGYITTNQYEQLSEFYKVYHDLGGNGQAEEYYHRAMSLGPKPDEK